jgi:hypothetical protein
MGLDSTEGRAATPLRRWAVAVAALCAGLLGFAAAPSVSLALALPTSNVSIPPCSDTAELAATVASDPAVAPAAIHFRVDGGAEQVVDVDPSDGTTAITVPEGSHSLEYWGEDSVGGLESPHHTASVLIDTVGPTVTITSNQGKTTYAQNESASIRVVASDSGSGLQTDPSGSAQPIATNVAGTFTVTRTAVDRCGNSNMDEFTYTVIAPASVKNLKIRPSSFHAASSGKAIARGAEAAITYKDTEAATTTFTVQRPAPGVIQKGTCVKPTRAHPRGRRCTRYLPVGIFRHHDVAGTNRFRFTGRVVGRKLPPGPYRLKAVARGQSGTPGPAVFAPFRILL